MTTILLSIIRLYQRTLSPDHGWLAYRHPHGFCRFHPTCSMYALEAIERHGARRGSWLAVKRLLRCHPWQSPQIDDVPVITR